MKYNVPGVGSVELGTIILDLNGTLTVRGKIVEGVHARLVTLKAMGYQIVFFTGNTRGNLFIKIGPDFLYCGEQTNIHQFDTLLIWKNLIQV